MTKIGHIKYKQTEVSLIPDDWKVVRLGEVCEIVTGATPRTDDPANWNGEILWATPSDMGKIKGFTIEDTERKISQKGFESCSTKLLPPGSVLLTTRAPIGHLAINLQTMCTNQGFKSLIPSSQIYNWFLFFVLKYFVPVLQSLGRGQTFTEISKGQVDNFVIPLPSLSKQKRIAAKIQKMIQEVERARNACEKQLEAVKALPAAYLRQVFESEDAKKWERKRLGEVCAFLDSMRIPVNDEERQKRIGGKKQTELYPYYGANGQVGWIDNFLFDEELVLLAEDGGFFGSFEKPISYRVSGKCWVNNHAHVLRTNREIIDVDWLYFSLAIRPDIMCFVSGTTRPKLNQEQASKIPIPLPSILTQQRIAADLKGKMAHVETLQFAIRNQQSELNALPQAILRKALRGEL